MAYNLPMQVSLQVDPGSLAAVRRQIESSFTGIQVQGLDTQSFAKTNAAIENTRKSLQKGEGAAQTFWDALEGKTRGIVAYTVASTALLKLTSVVSNATREAIKYEAELLKISQTTGDTVKQTNQYSRALVDISKKYNVTLSKVALLTRTLAQTGLSFREAAKGAEVLARTSLLASFDSIQSTTEGLIATMQTFSFSVSRAGKVLESINAVSKAFAVESGDIVEAIKRTGGAFSTAGGQIEELIALFTSVRSTTRESAETIATGFRTIFGRLQRPKTIEYFKQLGIQLETAEGQFIGPYQAILRISEGLDRLGISVGDIRFAEVVEQIGGIRQISRVIPLLTQAAKTQKALDVANNASTESVEDLEKAQQGLGFQLGVLQKEFGALISDVVNSSSFKFLADVFINVSKAVIRLTSSLKPLLPFLSFIATWKIGSGLGQLLGGKFNFKGIKESLGFASGGMVPGSGNGDTVPAMLTPGEFVIRKSAVQAFGADRLAKINKYASGGLVSLDRVKKEPGRKAIEDYQNINDKANDQDQIKSNFKQEFLGGKFSKASGDFVPKSGLSSNINWEKIALSVAGLKGNVFTKWAEEFEKEIGRITGMSITSQSRNDPSYPIDLEGKGKLAEVRMRQTQTAYETYLSKILRAKIDQKSSDLNDFKNLANQTPDEVDLKDFEVYETDPASKKEFLKYASYLGKLAKEERKDALKAYTGQGSRPVNQFLSGKSIHPSLQKRSQNIIENLNKLMDDDLPGTLYAGFGQDRLSIIDKLRRPGEGIEDVIDKVVKFPGFFSSSDNLRVAQSFARKGLMTVTTSGKKGIDVGRVLQGRSKDTSQYSLPDLKKMKAGYQEGEFILPSGSSFKITSAAKDANGQYQIAVEMLAKGGKVGTDTVPALLTPGEFVINKQSAQSFGYNNLKKINRYADGGIVQKFQNGGTAKPIGSPNLFPGFDKKPFNLLQAAAIKLANSFRSTENLLDEAGSIIDFKIWDNLGIALESYATALNESEKATASQINLMIKGYDKAIGDLEKSGKTSSELQAAESEMVKALKDATAKLEGTNIPSVVTPSSKPATSVTLPSSTTTVSGPSLPTIVSTDKPAKEGKTGKAERTVDKNRRKLLKEQALAKANEEAGGAGLTRAGRREAGQLARGADQVDFIAIKEKYDQYIQDEAKNAKEVFQAKLDQVKKEGGDISSVIQEYKNAIQEIKSEAKKYQRLEEESTSAKNIQEAEAQVKEKESQAQPQVEKATEEVAKATKTLAQKIKDGAASVTNAFGEINFVEASLKVQAFASALENFGGFDINQEALTQAQVKGGQFATAGELVGKAADPQVVKQFGSTLNQVGKSLPKSIGGPVRQLGGTLLKNADSIAKSAGMAAKALNVLSIVELGGGLIDSLFSVDYSSQRDNLIQLGDAAGAAQAAASAYAQEQLRAIPIIGGFLAAFAPVGNISEESLDANGRLVVANARLEASLNGVDDKVKKAKAAFSEAAALGDQKGQQDAINAQLDAVETLKTNADKVATAQQAAGGPSGFSVVGGAAGGALAGAAIGSFVPVIGTVMGGIIGAVAGGATAWYMSSSASEEQIIKGYELSSEAIKKGAEIQISLIEGIGAQLENEAVKMVRSGGTFEDAIKKVTEQVGEANMRRILDGRQLSGDPEVDIKTLSAESQTLDTRITDLKIKQSQEEDDVKKQAMQTQIDSIQADKDKVDSLKGVLVQTQAAIIREKQLEERRQLQAKAMEYQIKLMKEMETAFDGFNASLREANNIAEEAANIGTGRLTTRQAAQMSGVGDSRLYEMDSSEIVRNRDVATQMATRVGMGTMRGQEIMRGQERVSTIDRIQSEVVNTGALSDILKNLDAGGEKSDPKQIQDAIYQKLKLTAGADPVLDESIRQYSERIAKDGLSAAGQASQEAREEATKQSEEIIRQQQEKDKQLFEAQQKLRDMQIELVQRNMANAQQAYDNEKDYFDKRSALANKVEDFLNPIQEGPGRVAAMQQRGSERVGRQRSALQQRRGAQFQEIGLGGQSLGQAVNSVSAGLNAAGKAAGDLGTSQEQLKGQTEALLNTIQDEIAIEQEYLDTLIETAKAQQEYTQALNDAQGELVRNLVTGTEEEVGNQLMTLNAAAMAAQQGSFEGIPEDMKKDIFALFDQFGDVEIPGLGMTGRDAQREITKNELMRNFGYDEATASQLASKSVKDKVPVDERLAEQIKAQEQKILELLNYEKQLKDAQLQFERDSTAQFASAVEKFAQKVAEMAIQAGNTVPNPNDQKAQQEAEQQKQAEEPVKSPEEIKLEEEAAKQDEQVQKREAELAEAKSKRDEAKQKYESDVEEQNQLERQIEQEKQSQGKTKSGSGGRASANNKSAQQARDARIAELERKRSEAATRAESSGQAYGEASANVSGAETRLATEQGTARGIENNLRAARLASEKRKEQEQARREASGGESFAEITSNDTYDPFASPEEQNQKPPEQYEQDSFQQPQSSKEEEKNRRQEGYNRRARDAAGRATPEDKAVVEERRQQRLQAETTMPSQQQAQPQGPIQVQTQGQQEITIRLPDIQALVNQQITALVYETVGKKFNQVANDVRSADNFADVANALSGGISETTTQNV